MNYETIETISDKAWWFEVDFDLSKSSLDQHTQSICDKFFGLEEPERPAKIYMRPNGIRQWLGEMLLVKGLPICFVRERDSILLAV